MGTDSVFRFVTRCASALLLAAVVAACGARAPDAPQKPAATKVQPGLDRLGRGVDDVVLTGTDGAPVQWGALKGGPRAVFFGFTSCPEICPTTVAEFSAAMERLGPSARALNVDFVSVDPERDTPERLNGYLGGFGAPFRGFTGEESEVQRLATAFRAAYRRVPVEGGDYTMDHTTTVYLVDAEGQVRDLVAYQTPPETLDAQLKAFLAE